MDRRSELADFLRSRRARLSPEDAGVATYLGRRRVSGLRREEVAHLAGVSVDYYVRFEQGRAERVSEAVLDAVARALRLDSQERTHLYQLTRPVRGSRRADAPQRIRPALRHLLDAMTDVAVYVVGRRTDVLAYNRLGAALIADFDSLPVGQRNFARLFFSDEAAAQELWVDWLAKAGDLVAFLHVDAGRHPEDPALAELVGDLSMRSELFRRLWADHPVRDKGHATAEIRHPMVGTMELAYEALGLPGDPEQVLVTYSAPPGSAAADALRLLASWYADRRHLGVRVDSDEPVQPAELRPGTRPTPPSGVTGGER